MSSRTYSGTYADQRPGPGGFLRLLPWLFAVVTIGLQIAFPLLEQGDRAALTTATVVCFFLASTSHAWIYRGITWTLPYLLITLGIGFGAEYLGSRTGIPFGDYEYTDALTPQLAGVPVIVPLAWAMMAYPALVVGRRLSTHPVATPVIAAWALASWDLFLDPMMVGEEYWIWGDDNGPDLAGLDGIPVVNLFGWVAVALVMMALLDRLGRRTADDRQPAVLYLWTFVGGIVANVFFLDRPGVALVGGIGMGLVAIPFAWSLWNRR